jgi:hypothetical protein
MKEKNIKFKIPIIALFLFFGFFGMPPHQFASIKHKAKIILFILFLAIGVGVRAESSEAVYPVAGPKKLSLLGFIFASFVFFISLSFASPAYGATYYVDPDSGDNAKDGLSIANAWASIPGSVGDTGSGWPSHLVDGDIVYVKGGAQLNKSVLINSTHYSGSALYDSIQIISGDLAPSPWGTGRAIIDGQSTRYYGIGLSSVNGITIDGFEIRSIASGTNQICGNGSAAIEYCSATYIKIRRCYIHDTTRTVDDTGHGIETSGGSYFIVEHNTFGPNIGTKGIEPYGTNYGIIRYNIIGQTGDHGVALSGANWDVYNNLFIIYSGTVHDPVYRIKVNGLHNDLWNNVFENSGVSTGNAQNMFGNEAGSSPYTGQYTRFINNTGDGCVGTNYAAYGTVMILGNPGGNGNPSSITDCYFANNIATGCNNGGHNEAFWNSSLGANNQWMYNDIYDSSTSVPICYGGASCTGQYSVSAFQTFIGSGSANNNTSTAPVFAGGTKPSSIDYATGYPNTNYYALTASSPTSVRATNNAPAMTAGQGYCPSGTGCPAIEGYTTSKFEKDAVGNARTNWSIGAYEYVSSGDTTPPAAPQGLSVQ